MVKFNSKYLKELDYYSNQLNINIEYLNDLICSDKIPNCKETTNNILIYMSIRNNVIKLKNKLENREYKKSYEYTNLFLAFIYCITLINDFKLLKDLLKTIRNLNNDLAIQCKIPLNDE